jgi:hypothetical protein
MKDLLVTLETMNSPQLAMALVFIAGYGLALGRLLEGRARVWSAALATSAAASFVSQAADWVPAVMLIALVFALVAVLIAVSWTLTAVARLSPGVQQANGAAAPVTALVAAPALVVPQSQATSARAVM